MKILIISMANSTMRRAFQAQQAQRLGLDIEFVDAVPANSLSSDQLQTHANEWTRPIRAQDVACTLSHWKVWEIVASGNDLTCVLEDDVVLSDTFPAALHSIGQHDPGGNTIYDLEYALYAHTLGRHPAWRDTKLNLAAHQIFKNKRGAAAYVLGPRAAERLRAEAKGYAMMEAYLWTRRWSRPLQIEPCQAVQVDVLHPGFSFPGEYRPAGAAKMYRNLSTLRSKRIHLSISLNEAKQALSGVLNGERRPLGIERSAFHLPDLPARLAE